MPSREFRCKNQRLLPINLCWPANSVNLCKWFDLFKSIKFLHTVWRTVIDPLVFGLFTISSPQEVGWTKPCLLLEWRQQACILYIVKYYFICWVVFLQYTYIGNSEQRALYIMRILVFAYTVLGFVYGKRKVWCIDYNFSRLFYF